MYKIISHTNKSNLTYFSTSILISFTFPIALAQTSSTMLRKNREIGYVVLVLILWKCLSFFFNFYDVALCCLCIAFVMLNYILYIPISSRTSILEWCWGLSKAFSASSEMTMWFLTLFCLCGGLHLFIYVCCWPTSAILG